MCKKQLLESIKQHPEQHKHSFDGLYHCCLIDGAVDLELMEAHKDVNLGSNGGVKCDVVSGTCACGAWHQII